MTGDRPTRKDRRRGTLIWTSAPAPETDDTFDDTLTVIAALVEAPVPLTVGQLAHALGWTRERVTEAIERAEELSGNQSPVTVKPGPSNRFVVAAAPDRLTDAQRKLLSRIK